MSLARAERLGRAALLAAALAAIGCVDGPPVAREDGISLIHRRPDAVLDQPGEIVPVSAQRWHEFALVGWERGTRDDAERGPHAWTVQPEALLRLPAGPPADRTLELSVWAAEEAADAPLELEVRLNDVPLGRHPVAAEPRALRLPVPASVWLRGDNLLSLAVDRMHPARWGPRGLAVGRVRYDEPSRVEVRPRDGRLGLAPQTGARYLVEPAARASLAIRARALGAGRLEIAFQRMDPRTGALEPSGGRVARSVKAGDLRLDARLPEARNGVVAVDVTWAAGGPDARLEVSALRIVEEEAPVRPPIVFLSIDTLAARSMSLYGYGRATSPRLERWAAQEAVDFRRCKANAPWTVPSYLSQMTGLFPHANRVPDDELSVSRSVEGHSVGIWELYQLAPNRWTLAELLRAAGYRTAAIIDNMWLGRIPGFDQGFDHYDDEPSRIPIRDTEGGMRLVFPRALEWLAETPQDRPFFLFLQVLDCHGPYLPVEPWKGAFAGDDGVRDTDHSAPTVDYSSPPTFGTIPDYVAHSLVDPEGELPASMRTAPLIRAYDEKVSEVDAVVGDFLERLKELPFYDDALVVISADHGESMVEHGHFFRHGAVYEETIHVPLLVKLPGGAQAGTRVEDAVQLVDLYPTLADYAGIGARDYLHGRSLRPLLEGADLQPEPVVSQGNMMAQTSVELGGWKLIRSHPEQCSVRTALTHPEIAYEIHTELFEHDGFRLPRALLRGAQASAFEEANPDLVDAIKLFLRQKGLRYELFDLTADPGESTNLAERHPERVAALEARLEETDARTESVRAVASFSTETVSLDEEHLAELRNLGYLDDRPSDD